MIYPILPRLVRATNWFDEALRAFQERQGQSPVSRAQAMLLINIALGERRPVRLARTVGLTKQAVSLMLADLNKSGRLTITTDPDDARASLVDFSPSGRIELENVFEALEQLESHLADLIGEDRMAVLRAALEMDWGAPPVLLLGGELQSENDAAKAGDADAPRSEPKRRKRPTKR